jgi:Uma2 family endonuclease
MADNTKQFDWITNIVQNLRTQYKDDPNVFVAGDLLWYPIEGDNRTTKAPDVMVAFGRPKGHRGSYKQWLEDDIAPQVVFEIRSPCNKAPEMEEKFQFYQEYQVEEYYLYDPDTGDLEGWIRGGGYLLPIVSMHGWKSPRLGIRFELNDKELSLYHPDGKRFSSHAEEAARAEEEAARADEEAARAEEEAARADEEAARAEDEAARAEDEAARADEEAARADEEAARAEEEAYAHRAEKQRADVAEAKLARLKKLLAQKGIPFDEAMPLT